MVSTAASLFRVDSAQQRGCCSSSFLLFFVRCGRGGNRESAFVSHNQVRRHFFCWGFSFLRFPHRLPVLLTPLS
jgi:hypothetical protein